MFNSFYATNVKPAGDLRASDRLLIWGEIYTVTAYSVPSPGLVKLWVSPEPSADGSLPHNPLTTTLVHREFKFELAPE